MANATLTYDPSKPPVGLLAILEDIKLDNKITINTKSNTPQPILTVYEHQSFIGSNLISRYLARISSTGLYGVNPLESTEIDFFLDFANNCNNKDTLTHYADLLNKHLANKQILVGHQQSIADYIIYESLLSNPRWTAFVKGESNKYINLIRWFKQITNSSAMQNPLKVKNQKEQAEKEKKIQHSAGGHFDVDLPGAEHGKVVTRFPPEPSGYLHIGHAKAALLNDQIAKSFGGKLILRFDDTNPKKEKEEYVDNIVRDLQTLGITWAVRTHTSDSFEIIMNYAVQMLKEGKAYIDDTPVEQMRKNRMDGIESPGRNNSVETNLALFEEMKQATDKGLQCCMRAKIDMKINNKAMRDPVMYRCNLTPHHVTGTKWKVYPTYDFACPIVDSIEGVTHALRTNEYRDRNPQFDWFCDALRIRKPIIRDYSRLNFVYTTLSKRKLTWFVDSKRVNGWDDPRMPTIQGIIRRGMTVEALREFILGQGFSQMTNMMEWDKIWTINKRVLDPKAPRLTAISSENPIVLELEGPDVPTQTVAITVDLHPKNKAIGTKVITRSNRIIIEQDDAKQIKKDEEVTLMNWGNCIITEIITGKNGIISKLKGKLNLKGSVSTTDKKLTWLDASPSAVTDSISVELVELDTLISVAKVEEDMDFEKIVRPQSKFVTPAIGEQSLRSLNKGDYLQIPRRGYFIVDEIYRSSSKPLVLIAIPDGKMNAVSTLSTKVDKSQIFQKKPES